MYLDWPTSVRRIWRHFWAAAPSACLIPARSASAGCCFGFCSHLLLPTAEWYDPNWIGYPFGVFSGSLRPSPKVSPSWTRAQKLSSSADLQLWTFVDVCKQGHLDHLTTKKPSSPSIDRVYLLPWQCMTMSIQPFTRDTICIILHLFAPPLHGSTSSTRLDCWSNPQGSTHPGNEPRRFRLCALVG